MAAKSIQLLVYIVSLAYLAVLVRSESSTCFLGATNTTGHCKHGCCGTLLDNNQRCCEAPVITQWIAAVSILGGVLGISWIVCAACLVHKAIKNLNKAKLKVHPSKKEKREKRAQFVTPTLPEVYYTYPPQYPAEQTQAPPRLKSSLKNSRTQSNEFKEKNEKKLYPVRKNTEFTQVSYQPPSRSTGVQDWSSANQLAGSQNESGRERPLYYPSQTPESYY